MTKEKTSHLLKGTQVLIQTKQEKRWKSKLTTFFILAPKCHLLVDPTYMYMYIHLIEARQWIVSLFCNAHNNHRVSEVK